MKPIHPKIISLLERTPSALINQSVRNAVTPRLCKMAKSRRTSLRNQVRYIQLILKLFPELTITGPSGIDPESLIFVASTMLEFGQYRMVAA